MGAEVAYDTLKTTKAIFADMGWLGISGEKWRNFGLALAIIGAVGLLAPQLGFPIPFLPVPHSVVLMLIGMLINVAHA